MSMFCYQCQETARGAGCNVRGVCGKIDTLANLQDALLFSLKGLAFWVEKASQIGESVDGKTGDVVMITGKGHQHYQMFGNRTEAYSDMEQASSALEARMGKGDR